MNFSGAALVAPLNAPAGVRGTPGLQPSGPPIFIGRFVIVFGTNGGVFLYSGTPAPGNPPILWETLGTQDPYGNPVTPGIFLAQTVSSGNARGGLTWNTATPGTAEAVLALFPNSTVTFTGNSPFVLGRVFNRGAANELLGLAIGGGGTAGSSPVQMEAFSQSADGTIPGHVSFFDWASGNLICDVNVNGIQGAVPASTTFETWHSMALLNSWANVAGFVAARYRKVASPYNSVEIIGAINAAAATAAGFFTLPAGYRPASKQPACAMGANAAVPANTSPWIQCDTTGALTVQNTGAVPAAWESFFHGFISLDA